MLTVAAGASAAETKDLKTLMKATGLKFAMNSDGTACLLMRGRVGMHPVVVRVLKGRAAVMSEIVAVEADEAPTALWRKLAQANAAPRLAHAGLQDGVCYAVAGAPLASVDGKLLKAMVIDVAVLTGELQPVLKDLLAVE
jgi:hypothetical protein